MLAEGRSHERRSAGHYKDLIETGNRARKVFGTQGIITLTKFVIYKVLFQIKTQEIPRIVLLIVKQSHSSVKAEIRAVDSQSDLRV